MPICMRIGAQIVKKHIVQFEYWQCVSTEGTLKWNFQCPIVRELMLSLGLVDVSKRTLLKVIQHEDHDPLSHTTLKS